MNLIGEKVVDEMGFSGVQAIAETCFAQFAGQIKVIPLANEFLGVPCVGGEFSLAISASVNKWIN